MRPGTRCGNVVGAERATLTTALAGDDNDLQYTAVVPGTAGNSITITYLSNPAPGVTVSVTGTAITVNFGADTNAGGVLLAIEASTAASALVTVAPADASLGGEIAYVATAALSGGLDGTASGTRRRHRLL
jgi:hypothetical protein